MAVEGHTGRIGRNRQFSPMFQVVDMRKRLAGRHVELIALNRAAKHGDERVQHVCRSLGQALAQARQGRLVAVDKVLQAFVGAGEGLVMGWQDEAVFRKGLHQLAAAGEPFLERIGRWFGRVDRNIG